jgi:hypothetical protein
MPRSTLAEGGASFYGELRSAIKKHSGEELDIKPYEADMRHLLNTYVQADPAKDVGNLDSLSLTDLIIKTGIHDAIARKLNDKGKLSRTPSLRASSTTSARRSSAISSPIHASTRRCRTAG